MKQPEGAPQQASPLEAKKAARKPYQKPAVRYEQVFETNALTCGKVQTTQQQCHTNRKNS
ncbi:MAG: hypothetical protein ABSF45_16645 [Terriglobia bacterium]|jgi:hypothetical protein